MCPGKLCQASGIVGSVQQRSVVRNKWRHDASRYYATVELHERFPRAPVPLPLSRVSGSMQHKGRRPGLQKAPQPVLGDRV